MILTIKACYHLSTSFITCTLLSRCRGIEFPILTLKLLEIELDSTGSLIVNVDLRESKSH